MVKTQYEPAKIDLTPIVDALIDSSRIETGATELGFVWSPGDALLAFASSIDFLNDALSRANIAAVLVDSNVDVSSLTVGDLKRVYLVRNARLSFSRLHNSLRTSFNPTPTEISPLAHIHPTAVIASHGVVIGDDVVIEPFVFIQSGTEIQKGAVIRAGAQLGSDALDIKEDEDGLPYMTDHLGGVIIGECVEIGHHSVVDRSIFRQTATEVGAYTKIGCLSNISHGVRIGIKNKITAGVKICGSTVIGDENWIGPGAIISNLLTVGSRNYITLGANVLTNLEDEWKVVGIRIFKDRKLF
jgi:UDP-3-O-[3-hydroxymyristoyl] glucosamine N-acyltransferase